MSHPAIRRFQDHLRVRAGPLDLQPQRHRVVDDPHLAQAGQNVGPLCEVERRDNALALQPLVDAELVADVLTFMTRNLVSNFSLSSRLALVDFSPSAEA